MSRSPIVMKASELAHTYSGDAKSQAVLEGPGFRPGPRVGGAHKSRSGFLASSWSGGIVLTVKRIRRIVARLNGTWGQARLKSTEHDRRMK